MPFNGFTSKNLHSDRIGNDALGTPEHGALHKPIHNSVAFGYEKTADLCEVFQNKQFGFAYGRQANPTVNALENKVAQMENGIGAICFSSGMAAIGALLQSLLDTGDHLICSQFIFGNTNSQMLTFKRLGIEVDFADPTDVQNVKSLIKSNTRLVFVETIANPMTQIADLKKIGELCHAHNLLYVVDSTLTTPYLFQAKSVQAGLVIHALTKYIGGHGNALAGAIVDTGLYDWTQYPGILELYKQGPSQKWGLLQLKKKALRDFGAALAPDSAHLISIGSDTLALRMDRACSNAQQLAEFLNAHPLIQKVFYPGLKDHPQHKLSQELFKSHGALMSFELVESIDPLEFLDHLKIVIASSNLGDTRTLGIPVAHTIYYEMGAERRKSMGISDGFIRLSIGIEDYADLEESFSYALAQYSK